MSQSLTSWRRRKPQRDSLDYSEESFSDDSSNATRDSMDNELCNMCQTLNILPHKFLPKANDSLPAETQRSNPKDPEEIELGYLDDIYRRKNHCPFCRLVYDATHSNDSGSLGPEGFGLDGQRVTCWLDWQLDGRQLWEMPQDVPVRTILVAVTRRLRLFSKVNSFPSAYLVPINLRCFENGPSLQARHINPGEVNIEQLRSWLRLCEGNHNQCLSRSTRLDPSFTLRVVDVEQMCLVTIPPTERYCTLSYCWGSQPVLMLTGNTLAEFSKPGAFNAVSPPRTVMDAIELTRALGEKYIWVDSLCIIQGIHGDFLTIAPLMDKIYGDSIVTICAASGSDANEGLPRLRAGTCYASQSIQNCAGLELALVKDVEDRIKASPWSSRAWTYQERILSRRCLIFVDDRVFFQCREATWSEEIESESSAPCWTLDSRASPLAQFDENPLRWYARAVEQYSGRSITYQRDRKIAFVGIANSLIERLQPGPLPTRFYYCLPASHFDWALLWELKTAGYRTKASEACLPSWSWCGWIGASRWSMPTTSSTLSNLHEWIMERTWIVWYIGTKDGLQLLCPKVPEIEPGQGKWLGYAITKKDCTNEQQSPSDSCESDFDPYGRSLTQRDKPMTDNATWRPTQAPRDRHLQFFTWSAYFTLALSSISPDCNLNAGLHRFGILDCRGDWCGTVILGKDFVSLVGSIFEFIAISEAERLTMDECNVWTYYISEEREEAEWYLYYALMIRWNEGKTSAERLGLAKIYQAAFKSGSAGPGLQWKEITLG